MWSRRTAPRCTNSNWSQSQAMLSRQQLSSTITSVEAMLSWHDVFCSQQRQQSLQVGLALANQSAKVLGRRPVKADQCSQPRLPGSSNGAGTIHLQRCETLKSRGGLGMDGVGPRHRCASGAFAELHFAGVDLVSGMIMALWLCSC